MPVSKMKEKGPLFSTISTAFAAESPQKIPLVVGRAQDDCKLLTNFLVCHEKKDTNEQANTNLTV